MLYAVADVNWSPGTPLPPSSTRGGLYRSRSEAESVAAGRPTLALAVRYDAARGAVFPQGPVARSWASRWSAPAVSDAVGVVTAFGAIPAALVRVAGPAELRCHPGVVHLIPRPHAAPGPPRRAG